MFDRNINGYDERPFTGDVVVMKLQEILKERIGTNLIELRFISEEELTRFLGRFFNIGILKRWTT